MNARDRFKIVITGSFLPHKDRERELLADIADVVVEDAMSRDALLDLARDADAIMTDIMPIDAGVMAHAPKLRAIVVYGAGTDRVDTAAAAEHGVAVSNSPDGLTTDVAEHAIALLLALSRQVAFANHEVRVHRRWDTYSTAYAPIRLRGKTLGLIGFGRIGREAGRIATGIGMNVDAFDPYLDSGARAPGGVRIVERLDEVLAGVDAVSLHVPLTDDTRGMMGRAELEQLTPGALFVNVSRGPLVDQVALREALQSGRVGGAALDVFDPEPPDLDDPLLREPNLIVTPHIAWRSEQSELQLELDAVAEMRRLLLGERPKHPIVS